MKRLSNIRFLLLIVLIGAAIAGVNLAGWLDPLVMSTRWLHVGSGARFDPAAAAVAWTLMAIVIGLVFFAPRFWCRTLCPLGAALSLVARLAPYHRRTGNSCAKCDACSAACPMGQSQFRYSPIECIGCRRCEAACPEQAIAFAFDKGSIRGI
ncbi:MAG: 4Fe-4S binding protein [Planctomycetota bacterium]